MMVNRKNKKNSKRAIRSIFLRGSILLVSFLLLSLPKKVGAEEATLHAFYPSKAEYDVTIQDYIDELDSVSFAWSRIDAEAPEIVNTEKGVNGNNSFYYPKDYLKPIEYAKSNGKTIQLNIYMDRSDCTELLPYDDKRAVMVKAVMDILTTDITQGESIYYDGVVIDFEGLRDTDTESTPLLYEGKPISTYFVQFLSELKTQMEPLQKKLYVAVNPGLYYDGYDYGNIIDIADRVILMAHDYEPTERLQKSQVQQYTGYDAMEPINSMAPIQLIRSALNEIAEEVPDSAKLSKVWLQITFDSAQWQYDVKSSEAWETLPSTTLSREKRLTPLYTAIKARVDNVDGKGQNITYGYNNELQSPYLQYYNVGDQSWNIILYEDSNSITSKINLAKLYGLGGISLWSLYNVPDYNDANGLKYHLNGWATILNQMQSYQELPKGSSDIVSFQDTMVAQAVKEKLGKSVITEYDLLGIYRLKLPLGVKSLTDLKKLTNLEYLDAAKLDLKDISALSNLKNLRVLYLQRNQISDISALKKLTKLQVLSLNGNRIVSVSPLASLTKLQKLYLRENKLVSIAPLAKLVKLEVLELGGNRISQLDTLTRLTTLRVLSLDSNSITEIQAIKGLTGLKELYLQRNSITNISPLSALKKLTLLSLNGNRITDVKPLAKLTSLEMLYLRENKIKNIAALKGLTSLRGLYLGSNPVTDYSPVKKLYLVDGFSCDFVID